ncbi:MAG: hypothetical protein ACRYF4_10205 [Janthinobacterium lividum]
MNDRTVRGVLFGYLLFLLPLGWFAMRYDRYAIDGDAVSYMDIADLLHAHHWAGAVNAYWHPLYPALLWAAQVVFQTTRSTELRAYYILNFVLLLVQAAAMLVFVRALVRLRHQVSPSSAALFSTPVLQLLGLSLLTLSVMRELSLGKVRTDSLLQALILIAFAMLMESLAAHRARWRYGAAALMGLSFGLAYLTKSFAFVLALLSLAALTAFAALAQRRGWLLATTPAALALVVFAAVAGPYMAALSLQKHRLDFGDSGTLNYAWYVSGTEKMHLEPWMTGSFGSAKVSLTHPEQQLLAQPGIYSYKALPYGTYPAWFDATFFNERITPKFELHRLVVQDTRNVVLVARYLLNHPEPLILLVLLLSAGATLRRPTLLRSSKFAWPMVGLGLAMWVIYGMVNVEERYVTVAYFAIVLPLFAALHSVDRPGLSASVFRTGTAFLVVLFAMLTLGELLRQDLQNRRDEITMGQVPAWRSHAMFGAAEGLGHMGIRPGDEIACVGTGACLYDNYWARLAGVRVLTELYDPVPDHLVDHLDRLANREQAYEVIKDQGARVLVGSFDPGEMNSTHPAAAGWVRLGETDLYALPLQNR